MAVVRTARSTPPWALIVFVVLWVLSTTVAVLLYLHVGKAQRTVVTDSRKLNQVILPSEMQSPMIQTMLANANESHSVVGMLLSGIDSLENQMIGHVSKQPIRQLTSISGPAATALHQAHLSGKSLVVAVTDLAAKVQSQQARIKHLQSRMKGQRTSFATAQTTFNDNIETISQKLKSAHDEIAKLRTQLAAANGNLAAQAAVFQKQITAGQQKSVRDLETQVVKNQQLQQNLASLNLVVSDLRKQLAGFKAPSEGAGAILSQAQGKIIGVGPGENQVYINLGQFQKVPVGLTFAVYNPQLGVGSGISGGGKGSIVVTHVGRFASLCRINHVHTGQSIFTGDLIGNPVFQKKGREFHFYVYGDFAVNGNDVATAQGRLEIVRLIKKWGGVIDRHLTSQTDFLVLGAEPASPSLSGAAAALPQNQALIAARQAEQSTYNRLAAEAQRLSVPILNANRFLAMIGYYNPPLLHR